MATLQEQVATQLNNIKGTTGLTPEPGSTEKVGR